MSSKLQLPQMAPYPKATWKLRIMPEDWIASLDAWISLVEAHLSLDSLDFTHFSSTDESMTAFLISYMSQAASSHDFHIPDAAEKDKRLWKDCFLLTKRLLELEAPPGSLLAWEYLADLSKAYGKPPTTKVIAVLWQPSPPEALEASLASLKSFLIDKLEAGIKGDPTRLEQVLKRLNHLLHSSPETAIFFMSGTDFLDGLIYCFKLMNPPLRKAILSTTYLCLIGLTEGSNPNVSLLTDQLYALKAAAETHKVGPTNEMDSLVAELVTTTPVLKQIQRRIENSGTTLIRMKMILMALGQFRRAGVGRTKRLTRRRTENDKGKARLNDSADDYDHSMTSQLHVHRMSLISQVQDLFPDLGGGFILKLLDEYDDDVEQVLSHLLDDSLPAHLDKADRTEALKPTQFSAENSYPDMAPRPTPPLLPTRHNVFDDDEFDQLTIDATHLHFGKESRNKTADDILRDRNNAPDKASILSALASFDSDDDERDDTYDVEDVGGTVDSTAPGNNPVEADADMKDIHDEALLRSYKMTPHLFDRDPVTRRGSARQALRDETNLTDEAIEGWAIMLSRDPRRLRRLEAKFSHFRGEQRELNPTAWRADLGGSGTEDSDGGSGGRGGFRGRGGRGRNGRGRGGNVAGPTGEKDTEVARRKKEANKGSRANHNRKDANARKMARGGFAG